MPVILNIADILHFLDIEICYGRVECMKEYIQEFNYSAYVYIILSYVWFFLYFVREVFKQTSCLSDEMLQELDEASF